MIVANTETEIQSLFDTPHKERFLGQAIHTIITQTSKPPPGVRVGRAGVFALSTLTMLPVFLLRISYVNEDDMATSIYISEIRWGETDQERDELMSQFRQLVDYDVQYFQNPQLN